MANQPTFDLDVGNIDNMDEELANPELLEIDEEDDLGQPALDAGFYENIMDEVDEGRLETLVYELDGAIQRDKESRLLYDQITADGIRELGFDRTEKSGAPFPGASVLKTPILAKSALEFQAQAKKELMPQSGPARGVTYVDDDPELEQVRQRVEDYNNHLLMIGMEDYQEGFDQLLFFLSLLGSVFRKVYYSGTEVKVDTIHVQDFVVPWSTKNLSSCPRMTHVLRLHKHELKANFRNGLWNKVDLSAPDESDEAQTDLQDVMNRVEGTEENSQEDDRYIVHEVHCYANLEEGDDGDEKPYIITYMARDKQILSVRRNWVETDVNFKPRQFFVHYKFLPWDGFYGIGLVQLLGGLATASSGALRALMDAAMFQNLPGGMINQKVTTQGMMGGNQSIISPFQWVKVNLPSSGADSDIRKHVMPNSQMVQPSSTLLQLLQWISGEAEKYGSISVKDMMQADRQAPVGTTQALIEQQGIMYSSIHARQHRSFAKELVLINERLFENLGDEDDMETVTTVKGSLTVFREDFDGRVAVVPASDPSIFSAAQRVSQAQAAMQLALQAKEQGVEVDTRTVFIGMAKVLGMKDTEKVFPEPKPPEPPAPMDPVSEFAAVMRGQPAKAAPGQNHYAHIEYLNSMRDSFGTNIQPPQMAALDSLISDHVAQQAIDEATAALGTPMPTPDQAQMVPPQLQAMVAQAVAANAQQLAATRPPADGSQDAAIAAIKAETERKLQDDQQKAQLRVAEIQSRYERELAQAQAEAQRVALEREKFEYQKVKDAMTAEQAALAATQATQAQIVMNQNSNDSKERIEMAKIASKQEQNREEIASDHSLENDKLASQEAIASATLASQEQIAAAQIAAQRENKAVDSVDRALGEQMKIDIARFGKPSSPAS